VTLLPWLIGAVAVLLWLLVRVERRAAQPLIPMVLFGNRQLAITYGLAVAAGFGMGSVIFLTSIATLAYRVAPKHAGFVLLPLVVASMLGSMGAGRLLNRVGARGLIQLGFLMLSLGYGASSWISDGLLEFLIASVPVGLGVGIVVGGALRSIAIDEAPAALRAAAQGLINIGTAIGSLLAAAAISGIADVGGGGAIGFAIAYRAVAVLMLVALLVTFGLRYERVGVGAAQG
jgi:MFS family permease